MPEFAEIGALPRQFAGLARGFRASAALLAREAVSDLVGSALTAPPMALLREAVIDTNFSIVAESENVILFVFRRASGEVPALDSSVRFRIAPAAFASPPLRVQADGIAHYCVLPPFVVRKPGTSAAAQFAAVLGGAPDLFLRLGEGMLAARGARLAWRAKESGAGVPSLLNPAEPAAAEVPIALAQAIGEWVAGGFDNGPEVALDIASLARRTPVLYEILYRICEGWTEAWNETAVATYSAGSLLEAMLPGYSVADYGATVQLRMNRTGSIATTNDPDTFQLLLAIKLTAPNGAPRSRISAGPPDFLVSGGLRSQFLAALHGEHGFSETAALLGIGDPEERSRLSGFLLRRMPAALVFRAARGKPSGRTRRDTDLVVYRGDWSGRPAALVLSADFQVGSRPDPTTDYIAGTQRVVYSSLPIGARVPPQPIFAGYFIRLFACLRNWIGNVSW